MRKQLLHLLITKFLRLCAAVLILEFESSDALVSFADGSGL